MNRQLYLDINEFARSTGWAHGFMSIFALYGGVVLLGCSLIVAWWHACKVEPKRPGSVANVVWVGLATVLAVGLSQPINHLVREPRPYRTIPGVEVLVARANDFSFPSDHATVAGAVIVGLWLFSDSRPIRIFALVVGLFLVFARVYVGAHYPLDVIGGLAVGALTVVLFRPVGLRLAKFVVSTLDRMPIFSRLIRA